MPHAARWAFMSVLMGLMLLTLSQAASAKRAILQMDDGRRIEGDLVSETPTSVTVSIGGINASFQRDKIQSIEYELTLMDRYKEKAEKLQAGDHDARYALARWLYDQNDAQGDLLALRELQTVLRAQPDNQAAKLLADVVVRRVRARQAEGNGGANPGNGTSGDGPGAEPVGPRKPPMLDRDQCNLLKIFEINLRTKPNVQVPRGVVDDLFDQYRTEDALRDFSGRRGKAQFVAMQGYEQLDVMFKVQARNLYGQVIVRDEPEPLKVFRTNINPNLVVRHFMRHFKAEAQRIHLLDAQPNRQEPAYTNFLMLHRARIDGRPLIDRDKPRESILVQWSLPREHAIVPAPEVRGWRPYFTSPEDPKLAEFEKWAKSLYYPAPRYPIIFNPRGVEEPAEPGPDAPAEPAPAPAPVAP